MTGIISEQNLNDEINGISFKNKRLAWKEFSKRILI